MKRTTRNAVRTKQEIIEKSAPIFNVHGYSGTSMQMLVEATGYQMGGIYRHFGSKKALAKAAFDYNVDQLVRSNWDFGDVTNPKEKLRLLLKNYKRMVLSPAIPGGCPLLNTATEVDDTDKEFSKLARNCLNELIDKVEEILNDGQQQGMFPEKLNPKETALYLTATFEGAIMIGMLTKSVQSILSIFNQLEDYLERNVFGLH